MKHVYKMVRFGNALHPDLIKDNVERGEAPNADSVDSDRWNKDAY
jgi:hypothetical protein